MNNENLSDDELVSWATQANGGEAFACLIRRYQARIIRFAARFFNGNLDSGADIAQDTFLRLWENRRTYEPRGKLLPYLLRIAYNLSLSRLRSPESKMGALGDTQTENSREVPMELALAVQDAIQDLPEPQRVVFLLHEYEGLSYQEIADVLTIAIGTVASRKHSAVQALRVSLAPWFGRDNV